MVPWLKKSEFWHGKATEGLEMLEQLKTEI
jgi:hypothetical protein